MVRLPAALERKLQEHFPRVRERERFVADLVEEALDAHSFEDDNMPVAVGGTLHLFTDGGSRGNPGESAIGVILEDPSAGKVLKEHSERIGLGTNNTAEYRALISGLQMARQYQPQRLVCHLDSELVVRQVTGEYKVKMPSLQALVDEVQDLQKEFSSISFVHIPRRDNHRADALVNRALDDLPPSPNGFS